MPPPRPCIVRARFSLRPLTFVGFLFVQVLSFVSTPSPFEWPRIAIGRKSRPPQQQQFLTQNHTQPARPPHTTADRPASRGCSLRLLFALWPDSNARAIPTAQGLGLIPQLLWVARFSPDRHFTPRTPSLTQGRSRTSHRDHPPTTHGVWYTIRGCLNEPRRSRVDLNLAPTASPLMRSLMAHVRRRMAVAAWMSYVSPHIHRSPKSQSRSHYPAVPNPTPSFAVLAHRRA